VLGANNSSFVTPTSQVGSTKNGSKLTTMQRQNSKDNISI